MGEPQLAIRSAICKIEKQISCLIASHGLDASDVEPVLQEVLEKINKEEELDSEELDERIKQLMPDPPSYVEDLIKNSTSLALKVALFHAQEKFQPWLRDNGFDFN